MSLEPLILVVDDETHTREGLRDYLEAAGYGVSTAASGEVALALLKKEDPDIVLTDLKMQGMSGLDLLHEILRQKPDSTVMLLTAYGSVENAVQAMKAGAFHYLTKPVNMEELELAIKKALNQKKLEQENRELKKELSEQHAYGSIIGTSPILKNLIEEARRVAATQATVLLEGESGTGKELFAHLIHEASTRSRKPFITVHCAALTDTLLTSELFGHERGAFTGAAEKKIGRFERAHEGTLFLDEIAEMKEETQVKLLRVLQDGNFERVGGSRALHVDIRLICATNKNLAEEVRRGRFREDLFYRINVIRLVVPPLRERRDDIPLLLAHFLKYYADQQNKSSVSFSPDALRALKMYAWPGNIRELRNVVERLVTLVRGPAITLDDIPGDIKGKSGPIISANTVITNGDLRSAEKQLIEERLKQFRGNKSKVAKSLGISRRTLYRKIDEYKIAEVANAAE